MKAWYVSLKPHIHTRVKMFEISLHGSDVLVGLIVEACLANGARMANPEFTERLSSW